MLEEHGVPLPVSEDHLRRLNPYAVVFRYDDMDFEDTSRPETTDLVTKVRHWAEDQVKRAEDSEDADDKGRV